MNKKEADKIIEWMASVMITRDVDKFHERIDSLVSEDVRNHHRGTCFRVNEDYTKTLEQKLIDIECGECGKNMLVCRCDDKEE